MKTLKNLLFLALTLAGTTLSAQITYETSLHNFDSSPTISLAPLENSGPKLAIFDAPTFVLKLYNGDHSLFRTINIDVNSLIDTSVYNFGSASVYYIREELFDTDPGVEGILHTFRYDSLFTNYKEFIMVFDNNGTIIWSAENESPVYHEGDRGVFSIYNADGNDPKMLTFNRDLDSVKVYDLPGTWSCDPCAGGVTAIAGSMNGQRISIDNFPNPASNYTEIRYELPANIKSAEILIFDTRGTLLKTFQVDHKFDSLRLSTDDLAAGTYYYALQTSTGQHLTKKMVVIR